MAKQQHQQGLWDLSHIQPEPEIVVRGRHHARHVLERRPRSAATQVWMRQKKLGIWRSWSWRQTADAVREIAGGLMALGFAPGECASILSNTVVEWVLGRPGRAQLRRRVQRHLPDRRGVPGALPVRGLAHHRALRRGRRAARQGARSARAAAAAAQDHRVRHGWPARAERPGRHEPRCTARPGPRLPEGPPAGTRAAHRRLPHRRPGDPGLHLGHHRQAQGRDAQPPRAGPHHARLQHAGRAGRARRAHVLPAAVPHRRAHGRRVLRDVHRRRAQLRREPRDGAGERARDRAHRLHRRAARVGEVLFGRDDRAEGSEQRCSRRPTAGASASAAPSPIACSPGSRWAGCCASSSGWRAGSRSTTCAS